jgi:glutathione S-transferase
MTRPTPLRFKGAPGSPYTRKMLALLRYRHIPYEFLIGDQSTRMGLPEPKVGLLPTFYLPNEAGEIEAVVDSTPLIRRFEADFKGRSAIPENPVLSFLNYLIEDYGDEWLTKAMFHYRWYYDPDISKAARILPRWRATTASDENLKKMESTIAERQISRLYVVGSNDITAPVIEESYRRFLKIFDEMLQRHVYSLGERPGSADFAIYAQLTQLAKFDPTPASICLTESPRVYAWVDVVDDLSGDPALKNGWIDVGDTKDHCHDLLSEIGRTYAPVLLANAKAIMNGDNQMQTVIDGKDWQQPAFPYQAKCLEWLRQEFAALSDSDRATVLDILEGTGCEAMLA